MNIFPGPVRCGATPAARLVLASLLLSAIGACGSDAAPGSGPDGGSITLDAGAVRVLGTSDALTLVRDLEVAADGTVWVLDESSPFFVGFDPGGSVVAEFGAQGEGPQEFGRPVSLAAIGEGTPGTSGLWAYDRSRHTMIRLAGPHAPDGSAAGTPSVPFPREDVSPQSLLSREGGMPGVLAWIDAAEGSVFAAHPGGGVSRGSGYWTARVVELSLADGEFVERWDMRDFLPDAGERHPGATEFLPTPLWAVCPGGEAWMYDPARHRVRPLADPGAEGRALSSRREVELTGDRLFEVLVPLLVEEVPSSERPDDDELRQVFEAEIGQILDQFAEVFPEYYRMQCAPDETLWLQRFDWSDGHGGAGWTWERVRPEGPDEDPQVVRFPEGFQAFRITADRAWGVVRDELDVPAVAWIELP